MIDVIRSSPPPTSLARKKSYGGTDVRRQLHVDFLGKCYLCEGLCSSAQWRSIIGSRRIRPNSNA